VFSVVRVPVFSMPELRKDPVSGRWVIVSTERAARSSDFAAVKEGAREPQTCPFDPGNEQMTPPEVFALRANGTAPNAPGWTLRVVPNRFPALIIEHQLERHGEGVYDRMTGVGAHEVIIETPEHNLDLADLDDQSFRNVLGAYAERVSDLAKDVRFKYVLVFKNHGVAAGASLRHSHSQLIATPVVPKLVEEELAGSRQYYDFRERCIFCDLLKQERESGRRVVLENDLFVMFQPFAPRFPFESWIMPRRHVGTFGELTGTELSALASVLKETLCRLNRVLGHPDYNYVAHIAPLREPDIEYYHFHIEVMPKRTTIAGFEWGSGFFINPVPPEDAAKYLKEAS
jgi:UDPglucose--hexose-1-phosphate uridylyltransferase